MAPSPMVRPGWATIRVGSTWNRVPMPWQSEQAPYGLLNEKLRGWSSSNDVPHTAQA